jgi:hypothetical protein
MVMVAVGAALAGSACTPVKLGEQVTTPAAGANVYAIEITAASVTPVAAGNVLANVVVVTYTVSADGAPASLNQLSPPAWRRAGRWRRSRKTR